MLKLRGTERDVEKRMPVKMTRHFFEMARNSKPLQRLVKANPDETLNLAGSEDPGYQMDFAPVEGHAAQIRNGPAVRGLHLHGTLPFLLSRRVDQPEGDRTPGWHRCQERPGKDQGRYRLHPLHNEIVAANGGRHPETGREKLREVLLSGGDPMVLPNRKIGAWMAALAEAGVESIRLGTKEMSFHPKRFDDAFLSMLDRFHETYPEVGFRLMIHFNHPDEFLLKGSDGAYLKNDNGSLKWHEDTRQAMEALFPVAGSMLRTRRRSSRVSMMIPMRSG